MLQQKTVIIGILHFTDNPEFVIHHQNPWFGFSPDALLMLSSGHKEVIEMKSSKLGKELMIDELPDKLKFLTLKDTGGVALKTKHQYYSQLQLGLLLCNIPEGRRLVYTEKSRNNLEIRVKIMFIAKN